MRLLLDTAAFIYSVDSPQHLTKRASAVLRNRANVLELSAISLAEIAIKSALGKLNVSEEDAQQALADLDIRVLPYTAAHAFQLFRLARHHSDPFDRQIIAQALAEGVAVVTPDEKFGLYQGLEVVW